MKNHVLFSSRVHSAGHNVNRVASKLLSNGCQCRKLLVYSQQDYQFAITRFSNNLLQNRVASSRRQIYSRHWTSNTLKNATFLRDSVIRNRSSVARMRFDSSTGDDKDVTISSKTRKSPAWSIFENLSHVFRADELGLEIVFIALPAVIALAADPLASLVDTAFIGRIGPVELAAVGVSISVFNLVSKMFNVPLLNVTTSFVAEDTFEESPKSTPLLTADRDTVKGGAIRGREGEKLFLPAVSSALVLGTALGVGEACLLAFLAGPVLSVMGVGLTSPMRTPAVQYLALRGLGAPAVVVALAIQGVFRGFKDTKTPLYASVAGNVVNIVLDPILMFSLNLGVSGAAVATVASQYLIAGLLLWDLNKRVLLVPTQWGGLSFDRFLTSGGYLLGRTVALLLVMTLATSMAARQGAIPMAAHQICMQIWLAISLLSDSLALAGQAIVANAFAKNDYKLAKEAAFRVLQIGGGLGVGLALILGLGMPAFSKLFTNDDGVLLFMKLLIPFVALTQPINALAFVFDGLHYGASDFKYVAISMMALAVPSTLILLFLPKYWGLSAVWVGLTAVMSFRMLAGFWRLGSTIGPWHFLNQEISEPE